MSEIVDAIAWIVRKTFWSLGVLLEFLGLRLLDLLGLVFNILACCTVFRLPFMIAELVNLKNIWWWRIIGVIQLAIFIFDIPIFVMALFILVTMWRVHPCYVNLKGAWSGWQNGDIYYTGWDIRKVIIKEFFKSCIDIFCLPTSFVLLLSWRCVIFVREIKTAKSDSDRRKVCFVQFFQLLLDIPLLILTLPAIFSWRLPFFIRKLKKHCKDDDWDDLRVLGPIQTCYLFVDLPCLIIFSITVVTWRCPILLWQLNSPEYSIYKKRQQWKIRKICALQFLYLFLDIPCIVFFIFVALTMWRLPTFVRRTRKKLLRERAKSAFYKKEMQIRQVCAYEFIMIFVDVTCFVFFVVVFCTLWRTYPLLKDIKGYLKRYRGDKKAVQSASHSNDALFRITSTVEESIGVERSEISDEKEEGIQSESETSASNKTPDESEGTQTTSESQEKSEEDKKAPLTWSKCMWKLRKTICIHFAMLLFDIPAIPLCILLLITVLRTSRLLSDLLGGMSYMLFAVTVYHHTLHFFIDLFFILIFLLLVILRPIQVWINLLEDEEHKKHRELTDIMKWMPDIIKDRHKTYARMDDIVNLSFKSRRFGSICENELQVEMDMLLDRIRSIVQKLDKHEIDDEYVTLVKTVLFYEEHRVSKTMRILETEKNYLHRPDTAIRNQNLTKLRREKFEYDRTLGGFYEKLKNYQPVKVPLYENKSGLSLRTRDETKKVLIKTLPSGGVPLLIGILLCCIPLYRAPKMIYRLFKRWYKRFDILKETLYEYMLDFLTILRILMVLCFLYRAPFILADIFDCVIEKRSWRAVRKVVKRYPSFIVEDIFMLLGKLFSWETPRFFFTALLFGFFMPADLFLTVSKTCSGNKCIDYLLTILLYVIFIGFPFAYAFYGAEKITEYGLAWTNMVFIGAFIGLLLVVLLLMVVALVRDKKKSFLLKMPDADYIRYNWTNAHVFLFEILEFLQSIALILKLTEIPMYGNRELSAASKIILFSFLSFEPIFWITVAVFTFWFFTCAAPIIFENILETYPLGTFGKRASWRLAVSVFGNTLFLFFVENFVSFNACRYERCPSEFTLGDIPANASCLTSTFIEDKSLQCWSTPHRDYAAFGLIGLVWYTTTALIFDTTYGDPESPHQDIGFSPVYNTVINIIKAAMVVFVTIITNQPYATLTCLLILNLISIIFTFGYKLMFKHYPCNFPSVLVWRVFTFVSSCVVIVALLIAYGLDDPSSKIPLIIIGVGILVVFLISLAVAIKLRRISRTEKEREEFRYEIELLEKRIAQNKWFMTGWKERRKTWLRLIRSVRSAQKGDKSLKPKFASQPPPEPENPPPVPTTNYNSFDPTPTPTVGFMSSLSQHDQEPTTSQPVSNLELDDIRTDIDSGTDPDYKTAQSETPGDTENIDNPNNSDDPEKDAQTSGEGLSEDAERAIPPTVFQPPPCYEDIGLPPPPSYEAVQNNQEYYNLRDVHSDNEEILRLEKNGRNLLVILEKYIDYRAYRYAFYWQRDLWLDSAWNANWPSLLQCLRVLNKNMSGDFDRPSALDISLAKPALETDVLVDDPKDSEPPPPPFVRLTLEMKTEISKECRQRALADIGNFPQHGAEWREIFDRILPSNSVIKSWSWKELDYLNGTFDFQLQLRRSTTGRITRVDETEGGNKLAIGVTLSLGKTLSGSLGSTTLSFLQDSGLVGKKGPVSLNVTSVSLTKKGEKLYALVSGKKAPLAVVFASSKEIEWD